MAAPGLEARLAVTNASGVAAFSGLETVCPKTSASPNFDLQSRSVCELSSRKGPQNDLSPKAATDQPDIGKSRAVADFEGYTVSAWSPEYGMICSTNPVLIRIRSHFVILRGELPNGNFARVVGLSARPRFPVVTPQPAVGG